MAHYMANPIDRPVYNDIIGVKVSTNRSQHRLSYLVIGVSHAAYSPTTTNSTLNRTLDQSVWNQAAGKFECGNVRRTRLQPAGAHLVDVRVRLFERSDRSRHRNTIGMGDFGNGVQSIRCKERSHVRRKIPFTWSYCHNHRDDME
jgi:hypothetical protein